MKIKKILALLSAVSMLACMTACGDEKDSSSKKEIQTETVAAEGAADSSSADESSAESTEKVNAETSAAAETSSDDGDINDIINNYSSDNAQDTVIALLEKGFATSFGDNMKLEYNDSTQTYELAVWQDGFASALDTDAGVKALNTLSSNLTSALSTMETQIQMLDKNAKLKFSFLSDEDETTPLLVIENGEITYDVTKAKLN